ncbi:hypothetical protein B296_00044766 [Ensete ventricosum]|uniref:RRM domain-containing protein n=1 Tax=Ensete ventricosum TaxID=4639 RepID=A0A426Z9R0_ENSVE|nr:hypothetical protein B296_00044766 [Ensete ventricosum]
MVASVYGCRIAYMDFKDQDAFSQALDLNGSELGGYTLTVDEAKPRSDNRDGGWSGGRGGGDGGWSGGRGGGRDSAGRSGGRFGGRGGGRGGRGRGGGGRGRGGTPYRQSAGTASTGIHCDLRSGGRQPSVMIRVITDDGFFMHGRTSMAKRAMMQCCLHKGSISSMGYAARELRPVVKVRDDQMGVACDRGGRRGSRAKIGSARLRSCWPSQRVTC